MENIDYLKLLGQVSLSTAILLVLARIIFQIGNRMIKAIDKVAEKIEEHTKADLAAMAEVRADLEALAVRIDTALDLTPIRGVKKYPRPSTQPQGYYAPRKPPRDEDE